MAGITRGRISKAINDFIDSEILEFKNQIVQDKNSKYLVL